MKKYRIATLVVAVMLILGIIAGVVAVQAQSGNPAALAPLPAGAPYQPNSAELSLAQLYQRVIQSVVNVSVAVDTGLAVGSGTGSGFVIDTAGHIVTNNHVVENATYIEVTFVDGTTAEAKLVGRDPEADLAVIHVDPAQANLVPVTLADSDRTFIGQQVLAIGSPFNQDFTLTTGIVSALDRSLQNDNRFSIPNLIQTDAAINPGNSGGPLLDMAGDVIGVNTAILTDSGSGSGVGFAIPANAVRRIVPYLIANGSYTHSWLGIAGTTVTSDMRAAMSLSSDVQGVMVSNITSGGPASKAGLQGATGAINTPLGQLPVNGDIITAINGQPVTQMDDLIAYLETDTLPNDVVTLTVLRDGSPITVQVTLGARPQSSQ
jgi:S1-C subfamily serine protease